MSVSSTSPPRAGGKPNNLLPRPLSSSGTSATGNTSKRPSLLATATKALPAAGTKHGANTFAPSGTVSTALPARLPANIASKGATKP